MSATLEAKGGRPPGSKTKLLQIRRLEILREGIMQTMLDQDIAAHEARRITIALILASHKVEEDAGRRERADRFLTKVAQRMYIERAFVQQLDEYSKRPFPAVANDPHAYES